MTSPEDFGSVKSKPFQRGLVVGKFAPLHRGHQTVIERALAECEQVALISYTNPEFPGCSPDRRAEWLATLYPDTLRLVVDSRFLDQFPKFRPVPHNDDDEIVHRRYTADLCTQALGITVDAVFTSESYGDGFAAALTDHFRQTAPEHAPVRHVLVDPMRRTIPISGTDLRQAVETPARWLDPVVTRTFRRRICLLGGESSGKSTLAAALAQRLNGVLVPEFGRELWETQGGRLEFDDLLKIARSQIQREDEAQLRSPTIVCDTSPLTTLFYSLDLFGRADPELLLLAERPYDSILLCAPDFPFVQDGTRRTEKFRAIQHQWFLDQLRSRRLPYTEAAGSVEARLSALVRCESRFL